MISIGLLQSVVGPIATVLEHRAVPLQEVSIRRGSDYDALVG